MKIDSFEDVQCWQKARALASEIYSTFGENRDFSFRDQIQCAAVSVMNNIAEGFERKSNSELKHYLYIAKGSCGEVRSMLHLAMDLKYIPEPTFKKLHDKAEEISKMLSGFIKAL